MAASVKLLSGEEMPLVGLGTWKADAGVVGEAVKVAVRSGYRLIDCANDYGNEREVGHALAQLLREGVVKRGEIFVQGKLWNSNHRKEHVREDLMATLQDLQLEYLDSYLIHWPQAVPATGAAAAVFRNGNRPAHKSEGTMFPLEDDGRFCSDPATHFMEAWFAMEELMDEGLVKSIGVSNFNHRQLLEVVKNKRKHMPSVIQNECHPFLQQKDLIDLCNHLGVVFQAYSPLGSGDRPWIRNAGDPELLEDERLMSIAQKHGMTAAQVVLRWQTQRGVSIVPKSVRAARIRENLDSLKFKLDAGDMDKIASLNIGWRYLLFPQSSMHPDYPFKDELPHDYVIETAPLNTTMSTQP
eukprot:CAMPEP_0185845982 /NCGR_PEP_ID=MMETSP1354-20130828/1793_1 /TAXON_ID=708628 /ORGANISM="Erythrolobus madagascarensis, Strain CCMP3276" /LENGTH=354 /DNA_ID=CAMNT_0028546063 /DNA_START=57 /DNA_END=1121 /DNA_ORIENTATION=-